MQQLEIIRTIGRLETGLQAANQRITDEIRGAHAHAESVRRELMGQIAVVYKTRRNGNGHGRRLFWAQAAALAAVVITSLAGLISPEKGAAIIRAIMQGH